jgi:tRNA threonylcarbamoyladenosine biosynthesis protein TsaE
MEKKFTSDSIKTTHSLGARLGRLCKGGEIICLIGNLGSGKTTFTKGVADGLKIKPSEVHSPTFILMDHHKGRLMMYHFDLYRLEKIEEIERLGYEEFFFGDGVSLVEWADKLSSLMPKEYLEVRLEHKGDTKRGINLKAFGKKYETIINKL